MKKIVILSLMITGLIQHSAFGAAYHQQDKDQQVDTRKQQLQAQAQMAAQKMDEILRQIYNDLNEQTEPDSSQIQFADQLLDASRRCMIEFEDNQKADYFLLRAWVDYSQGDLSKAVSNSGRACRLNATNPDAWISQQFFSVLEDQRPLRPRPPRRTNDPFNQMDMNAGQSLYGAGGILRFDPDSLRHDVIGKSLSDFQVKDLEQMPVTYKTGKEILCILVWQIDTRSTQQETTPAGADPLTNLLQQNIPGDNNADTTNEPGSIAKQAAVLQKFSAIASDNAQIRFMGLNTNSEQGRAEVRQYVRNHNWPWPEICAVDDESLMALRINAETPFVMVVNPMGQVKFAGSPEGFFLPMLLTKMTGIEFQSAPTAMLPTEPFIDRPNNIHRLVEDPNLPVIDPNLPVMPRPVPITQAPAAQTQPQPPAQAQAQPAMDGQPTQYRQLPEEEAIQAEKLLTYTRDLFMKMAQRRFTSYKQGVDNCRLIMRNYPGTVYAAEAQQLLRQVPENRRDDYNITNEELGL